MSGSFAHPDLHFITIYVQILSPPRAPPLQSVYVSNDSRVGDAGWGCGSCPRTDLHALTFGVSHQYKMGRRPHNAGV